MDVPATVLMQSIELKNHHHIHKFARAMISGPDVVIGGDGNNGIGTENGDDVIEGRGGVDSFHAGKGRDTISGGDGNDWLWGEEDDDVISGDGGRDNLRGGDGADTFVYNFVTDSTVSSSGRDMLFDFQQPEGDRVDLSAIDANTLDAGDQAFMLIGTAEFSGAAGELRYVNRKAGTFLYADVDGDGSADFAIKFKQQVLDLTDADFVL